MRRRRAAAELFPVNVWPPFVDAIILTLAAFVLLTLVLRAGLSIGVAYGIWGALGTVGTAVLAAAIFGDPFTWPIGVGIGLIIAGVLLVELGARHTDEAAP